MAAAERGGGRWKQHGAPLETFSRLACQSEMALAMIGIDPIQCSSAQDKRQWTCGRSCMPKDVNSGVTRVGFMPPHLSFLARAGGAVRAAASRAPPPRGAASRPPACTLERERAGRPSLTVHSFHPGLIEQLAAFVTQRASCVIELEGGAPLTVSDLDSIFQDGILRNRMGAAAARSGAPCVPTATPGPWDIPPAIGDAWFIHYPIYTGCVAARLETRSAAQRAEPQTTKQIRRRPWRHPLWRQPRKRHSLAGKDYG